MTTGAHLDWLGQPSVAHAPPSGRAADAAEEGLDFAPAQEVFRFFAHLRRSANSAPPNLSETDPKTPRMRA